jgi:hypothetical protein
MVGLSTAARKVLLFTQENGDSDAEIVASGTNLQLTEVIHANMELSENELSIIQDLPNVVELSDEGRLFDPLLNDESIEETIDKFNSVTRTIILNIRDQGKYPSKEFLQSISGFSAGDIETAIDELSNEAFITRDKIQ